MIDFNTKVLYISYLWRYFIYHTFVRNTDITIDDILSSFLEYIRTVFMHITFVWNNFKYPCHINIIIKASKVFIFVSFRVYRYDGSK